ncbi:hypothetical protein [Acinetobacter schindleri]|uniref:hypothetical protein n=1 Tax=Acinetobacter schindleri TaxID=108981 RepID=UPI001C0A21E6|nr:hypothetical protein [Acinetobacter schindleri]
MDFQNNQIQELFEKLYVKNAPSWALERDSDGSYKYHATQSAFSLFEQQQAEIELLKSDLAKAQAVPEGFVLVKKELPEQIAEKMAIDRIDKPRHENDPVWSEIAEQSYKDQVKSKKWEFWRDYKTMIEAQEPAND